ALRKTGVRLLAELLEDRTLPSNGQWYAVFRGMAPGASQPEQTQYGQNLLHSAGVLDQDASVIAALDLSGTFLLQSPPNTTQQALTSQLQRVPGFVFVDDYESNWDPDSPPGREDEDGGDLIDRDYYEETFGPFDYYTFRSRENGGEFPDQGGPAPLAAA